jgi:hypothetical protein
MMLEIFKVNSDNYLDTLEFQALFNFFSIIPWNLHNSTVSGLSSIS